MALLTPWHPTEFVQRLRCAAKSSHLTERSLSARARKKVGGRPGSMSVLCVLEKSPLSVLLR
eukprot:5227002-Amphidinium_carterae.2